ncbi:MAG: hypothetical protein JWO36_3049 [Myxococcales bacterium]|nr:hypothetical protein [Myxococcales bacterium]
MVQLKRGIILGLVVTTSGCVDSPDVGVAQSALTAGDVAGELPARNPHGISSSVSTQGPFDFNNPFFDTTLGTNGRSCATCHDPRTGWTISADLAKELFNDSDGLAPLFNPFDGGTRPDADLSSKGERKKAFDPITDRGLIRFGQGPNAPSSDFDIIAVADPYGFGTPSSFTRFRRPNPTSNEHFTQSLTWIAGPQPPNAILAPILFGIAVSFHGQGTVPPSAAATAAAVAFQLSIVNAQAWDNQAGRLDEDGAKGGPVYLAQQPYFPGINSGASFDPHVFDLYDAWKDSPDPNRRQIARGQDVFNFKTFGPNNARRCSGCHNTPNVGASSTFVMLNVGTDVPSHEQAAILPILTVRNKVTGEIKDVTEVGRALSTGKWADIGKYRVPHLRGLASRAPFFHDGQARDIEDVVNHYEAFFGIEFTGTEKQDLEAFLYTL